MSITQLASFNPRQLKQFSRRQINALPDALWNRLNRSQTRALVNAYSSRRISSRRVDSEEVSSQRSSDMPKRRIMDIGSEAIAMTNQHQPLFGFEPSNSSQDADIQIQKSVSQLFGDDQHHFLI